MVLPQIPSARRCEKPQTGVPAAGLRQPHRPGHPYRADDPAGAGTERHAASPRAGSPAPEAECQNQ